MKESAPPATTSRPKLGQTGRAVLEEHLAASTDPPLTTQTLKRPGDALLFRTGHWHCGPASDAMNMVIFFAATGARKRKNKPNDRPIFPEHQEELPVCERKNKKGRAPAFGGPGPFS